MARSDLRDVEERLERVLARATGLLPDDQLSDMASLVRAGEPGIALENLCTQLHEYDVSVTPALATELDALAATMGLRLSSPLKVAR
jgi:hypothetical protein